MDCVLRAHFHARGDVSDAPSAARDKTRAAASNNISRVSMTLMAHTARVDDWQLKWTKGVCERDWIGEK